MDKRGSTDHSVVASICAVVVYVVTWLFGRFLLHADIVVASAISVVAAGLSVYAFKILELKH